MKQDVKKLNVDTALVIGDVHGNYDGFSKVADFACKNNLTIISLGDLVDYGTQNFKCVELMHRLMFIENRAHMIIGNHDDKFHRWITQMRENDIRVQIKGGLVPTLEEYNKLPIEKQNDMLDKFEAIYNNSSYIIIAENSMFVHGAAHPEMWYADKLYPKLKSRAIYGQANGFREDGFPNRIYDWVETIPYDHTVYFGHDVIDVNKMTVLGQMQNVFSVDTGSSKDGKLTGVIVEKDKNKLVPVMEMDFTK